MKLVDLIRRADELVEQAEKLLQTTYTSEFGDHVDRRQFAGFRVAVLSFLINCFGREHPYYAEFDAKVTSSAPYDVERGEGILRAAHEELAGGWIHSTRGIVSAEVFSDFMEMGDHLLTEGYKDPAAVMIGSVLEEHLRQL